MTNDDARELLKQAIDPVTLAAIGVSAGVAGLATKKIIERLLKKKGSHDSKEVQRARHMLHKMVRPVARKLPYKTKGAKGWDVMVDAVLSDSQSTGATSGR